MLNITRRRGERIVVGDDIFVSIIEVSGQTVRIGIDAPRSVPVYREEIWLEVKAQNQAAAEAAVGAQLPEGELPQLAGTADVADPGADAGAGQRPGAPQTGTPDARPPGPPVNRIRPRS